MKKFKVITLCGSTRFRKEFERIIGAGTSIVKSLSKTQSRYDFIIKTLLLKISISFSENLSFNESNWRFFFKVVTKMILSFLSD